MLHAAHLIFPHQLFRDTNLIPDKHAIYLIEENLFFTQYSFHKQKLIFHRASMKAYAAYLSSEGYLVTYVEANQYESDVRTLIQSLAAKGITQLSIVDVCDDWLSKRMTQTAKACGISIRSVENPSFINTTDQIHAYFDAKRKYHQTDFYIHQRKQQQILLDQFQKPIGGKWTYDADNRSKYPKNKKPPALPNINLNSYYAEAITYIETNFSGNYGKINSKLIYPTTFEEAQSWMNEFFLHRFADFGIYEDAIVGNELSLHHSLLSMLLNSGLLLPDEVIKSAIAFSIDHSIPINSLEGFIRQITGWREFVRAMYMLEGRQQRTRNFWGFTRKIPPYFYNGTTGIVPLDTTIKKVFDTGYAHHIERLMIVSNFMLLCEFDPDDVYQWFMELFIDAYDWVMVPNVYGMGQFSDGGLMCTKPYISGSNYILKMSDYKKAEEWTGIWDALFWRFLHTQRDFFTSNPRLGMLVKMFDKMDTSKQQHHLQTAEQYLNALSI